MEAPSEAEAQTQEVSESTESTDLPVTSSETPPPSSNMQNQSGTSGQETSFFTASGSKEPPELAEVQLESTKDPRAPEQEAISSNERSALDEIVPPLSSVSTPPSEEHSGQGQLATSGLEGASRALQSPNLPLNTWTDDKALFPPQGVEAATTVRAASQNQPASGAIKVSSSTSYFPSPSAITSFFSSGAKASSPPKQPPVLNSASSASLKASPSGDEETTDSQVGGTGRGTLIDGGSKAASAVSPTSGSTLGPTTRSFPATSPPSASSFAALVNAAASYVKPAQAKTPKHSEVLPVVKPSNPEPASNGQEGGDRPSKEAFAEVPGIRSDRNIESDNHPSLPPGQDRPAGPSPSSTSASTSTSVQKDGPLTSSSPVPIPTPQDETAAQSDLPLSSPGPPSASSLAQAPSPSTSYLSLPSFLPSWSTLTAQLPSIPNTSFSSSKDVDPTGASPAPSSSEERGTAGETSCRREPVSSIGVESTPASAPFPSAAYDSREETEASASTSGIKEPGKPPQKRELDAVGAANAQEMAAGIAAIFGPVTREADKQVEAALRSQERLALSIDRLTKGLDKLLEETPQPLVSQQAARLAYLGKRVKSLGSTLKVIQGRIDSMNWALDRKSARAPVTRGRSATAPNSPQSYQAPSDVWATTSSRNAKERSPLPTSWELRDANQDSQETDSQSGSMVGPRGHDIEKASMKGSLSERPSSRSPDKGHRRAVSHDVRFSSALLPRR